MAIGDGIEPECVLRLDCELGEGPVWRPADGTLWFVDIKAARIHRWSPATGARHSWDAPAQVGFLAPRSDGRWIAGLRTGLHSFDPDSGVFDLIREVEAPALGNRLNDGFVDRLGALWFGSMHDAETEASGALYRYDGRGLTRADDGYCITNGPAASRDGRTLYHTDTLARTIYAFDLDAQGGLSNRRMFAHVEANSGYPDGLAVDAEDCVWTGLFGGWAARRYDPSGALMGEVRFPVANVTKIAFGDDDLRTAFATTARKGLSAADLARQPLAGSVFSFRAPAPGLPPNELTFG